MRIRVFNAIGSLCATFLFGYGCASTHPSLDQAPPQGSIGLPSIKAYAVDASDGIDEKEAASIASAYLAHYITLCGMPDEVERRGAYWITKLWTGLLGSHFSGTFWISRTTGEVTLQPPPKGLRADEMRNIEMGKQFTEELRTR